MSPASARRTIIFSLAVAAGLAAVSDLRDLEIPRLRIVIGAFAVGIVLTAASEAAPELSGSFAVLILITSLLTVGADTIRALGGTITEVTPT